MMSKMVDLEQYRENARANNLCDEYTDMWDSCNSNKQLVDMGFGVKGLDYLCDTIAKGWGLSPDVICDRFHNFINGRYISHQKGYTSKMYCKYEGEIKADTTAVCLIKSNVRLDIPQWAICEVFCTLDCHIEVTGEGRAIFICYGDPNSIHLCGDISKCKRINKKERDTYA